VKTGILGGTFDPIHIGHLILAESAREELGLGKVIFIPTGEPWRKAGRDVSDGAHRLAMADLAVQGNEAFQVSPMEVERPGPSYLYETLEELERDSPGDEMYFLLGADALADLPNWREPKRIVELATLAVARRGETTARPNPGSALKGLEARLVDIPMPEIGISATAIRQRVKSGKSIKFLVPAGVELYIGEQGLYR
jgi:nicotinate-nucleotide adenylyltransferase